MTVVLKLDAVDVGYGTVPVNRSVGFEIDAGEVMALIGRNGVGKSTLVRAITGQIPVSAGRIEFEGQDITRMPAHLRARLGVGYVPQGRDVFVGLTVEENLTLGAGVGVGVGVSSLDRAYGYFPLLAERRNIRAGVLSGGQQQILAIGRVLVGSPRLLVLDEPSDGIQPSIIEEISVIVTRLNREQGLAVLLIEQNVDLIMACAHRCLVVEKGEVVNSISGETLTDGSVYERYLSI